jgi:polysaccharide export outer membrane protein
MRCFALCLLFAVAVVSHGLAQTIATLRPGDIFETRLSGMPTEFAAEFALQYTVGQDGTINVPLIGEVKAAGLTSTQLERAIQAKLVSEKIFTRPTVVINIAPVARYVSVSGGVRAPQRLQWSPDLTLASSIGNAGGIGDFGDQKKVRLVREGKVLGVFNLKQFVNDPASDPKLLPGDQVIVPE